MSTVRPPPNDLIDELREFLDSIKVDQLNLEVPTNWRWKPEDTYPKFIKMVKSEEEGYLLNHLKLAQKYKTFYTVGGFYGSVIVLTTMMKNHLCMFKLDQKDPRYEYTNQVKTKWEEFISRLESEYKKMINGGRKRKSGKKSRKNRRKSRRQRRR